ncbi:hypothetical protein TWF730_009178 [Orbilia blumenaviensis]|uniref:5'-deoxynucleotidase n=1 Tax=Orbilia blumenaviensis TaxID=1796055 RepID=A0AAV9V1J1_9PEZI
MTSKPTWTVESALEDLVTLNPLPLPTTASTTPLAFLHIIDRLKHIPRTGWVVDGVEKPETIASHMYRMAILAMLCPDQSLDRNKCIKMALVHDIAESVVGDFTPMDNISKEEKYRRESTTIEYFSSKLLKTVSETVAKELIELFEEYEAGTTPEAVFVKDIDVYDMILQAFEYEKNTAGEKNLERFMRAEKRLRTDYVKQWNKELMDERNKFWESVIKS